MSDTPRTDKESFFPHDSKYKVCDADFARQLERELNVANGEIERLTAKVVELYAGAEEQKQRINRLEEELMDTKNKRAVLVADVVLNEDRAEQIKRMEEAGDYLCAAAAFMGWHDKIETWNKAKEAK